MSEAKRDLEFVILNKVIAFVRMTGQRQDQIPRRQNRSSE